MNIRKYENIIEEFIKVEALEFNTPKDQEWQNRLKKMIFDKMENINGKIKLNTYTNGGFLTNSLVLDCLQNFENESEITEFILCPCGKLDHTLIEVKKHE